MGERSCANGVIARRKRRGCRGAEVPEGAACLGREKGRGGGEACSYLIPIRTEVPGVPRIEFLTSCCRGGGENSAPSMKGVCMEEKGGRRGGKRRGQGEQRGVAMRAGGVDRLGETG